MTITTKYKFSGETARLWHEIICLAIKAHNCTDQEGTN